MGATKDRLCFSSLSLLLTILAMHEIGQSEHFKPFEDLLWLLAKGSIYTQKMSLTTYYTLF